MCDAKIGVGGAFDRPADPRDYRLRVGAAGSYPDSYIMAKARLPKIQDQGRVQSCVAHALAYVVASYAGRDMSTNYIYAQREDGPAVPGMYAEDALAAVHKRGDVEADLYPGNTEYSNVMRYYEDNRKALDTAALPNAPKAYAYLSGNNGPRRDDIAAKAALMRGYPILAIVNGMEMGQCNRDTGIVPMAYEAEHFGHAVTIWGWRTLGGKLHWIVANSWGDWWGARKLPETDAAGWGYCPDDGRWLHMWAIVDDSAAVVPPKMWPTVGKGRANDRAAVVELQEDLAQLGYAVGGADGVFGAKTEAAIKALQQLYALAADGVCGAKTWAALDKALAALGAGEWTQDVSGAWEHSLKERGKQLSRHFTVGDLALDPTMTSLVIAPALVAVLDAFADHFGRKPRFVTPRSIYCKAGHSANSYHYRGMAADLCIEGVTPLELAQFAETLPQVGGVGVYAGWDVKGRHIHVDVRAWQGKRTCWWVKTTQSKTPGFGGCPTVLRQGDRSPAVLLLQHRLNDDGCKAGVADGSFGANTAAALRKWQQARGVPADGVFGAGTNKIMQLFVW